jgi:hypothetical protein
MWKKLGKQLRYHGIAPDGQPVHMFFSPYKKDRFTVWTVGLFVGGSNRTANDWYNKPGKKPKIRITGSGLLYALKFALDRLLEFASKMTQNEEIQIGWGDERRRRAYRYLLRYPNWNVADDCYFYRNPKYWYRAVS